MPTAYPPCALTAGCTCVRPGAWLLEIWQPREGWDSWETASGVTGSSISGPPQLSAVGLSPSGGLFLGQVRLLPPRVSSSTCLSPSSALCLSLSLLSSLLSLPPSLPPWKATPSQVKQPQGPPRKELGWAVFQCRRGCHGNPGVQHLPHPGREVLHREQWE